jgi:hypothetical protein
MGGKRRLWGQVIARALLGGCGWTVAEEVAVGVRLAVAGGDWQEDSEEHGFLASTTDRADWLGCEEISQREALDLRS